MNRRMISGVLGLGLVLAACGGGGGGGAGGGEDSDLPTSATATHEDPEGTTYPLAPGRYRLTWSAEDCDAPTIQILDQGGGLLHEQSTRVVTSFVRDVPGGEVTILQTNDECSEWEIELDHM